MIGPGLAGAEKIDGHGDGRGVEFSFGHDEHRRTHGVVEHRREDAALDEAGRIAELGLAVEADPDPAFPGPRIEQMPAEQLRGWRRGGMCRVRLRSWEPPVGRPSVSAGLLPAWCQHGAFMRSQTTRVRKRIHRLARPPGNAICAVRDRPNPKSDIFMTSFPDPRPRGKLPARYAAIVLPLVLSLLMTFVISGVSTLMSLGPTPAFVATWPAAWALSWAGRVSDPGRGASAGAAVRRVSVEMPPQKTACRRQRATPGNLPSPCAITLRMTLGSASSASVAIGTQRMPSGARVRAGTLRGVDHKLQRKMREHVA